MLSKILHFCRLALITFPSEKPEPHLHAIGHGLTVWILATFVFWPFAYFLLPGDPTDIRFTTNPWAAAGVWILTVALGILAGYRKWPSKRVDQRKQLTGDRPKTARE